ncbi:MAG: hypothetical protein HEEMFOPI_01508 [Holosporales bacterium]
MTARCVNFYIKLLPQTLLAANNIAAILDLVNFLFLWYC